MAAAQTATGTNGSFSYIGNPDFRGYIAANAPEFLPFVGNDGGINQAALNKAGGVEDDQLKQSLNVAGAANAINGLYSTFNNFGYSPNASSGGGGSSSSSSDPNAVAYYNDVISQLQSELGAAQGEQATGLNNINNAFNQSNNELNQSESAAESGYNTSRANNGTTRETNLGQVNTNANSAYNGLMALLAAGGAGVSSAARFGAPQAVSQNASEQRQGVDTTYNTNDAAITSAEDQTKQQYQNALTDLLTTKNTNIQNFLSGLLGQEANIEQQIGSAKINAAEYGGKSYSAAEAGASNETNAVKNIEGQLGQIFNQYATPSFNVTPVTATTPNLTSYNVDPTTIKAASANPTTDSSFLPYLASLKQNQGAGSGVLTGGTATAATAGAAT